MSKLHPDIGWLERHEAKLLERVRTGQEVRGEDVVEVLHDLAELRKDYMLKMRADAHLLVDAARKSA